MRFYTTEKLGEKQSLTPEGFLVVEDVPVARTGTMIYGPGEVPISVDSNGVVRVHREAEEVFRPEYIASLVGKPVVNDHPSEDVRPDNWKKYTVGTMLNPRRGTGMQSDLLIADFIIVDPAAIKDVRGGKREVSLGYDADYEEVGPGEGKQTNMICNHVALVDAGRCGPRCAIGDNHLIKQKDIEMKTKVKVSDNLFVRLMKAFKAKDEEAFTTALTEAQEEDNPDDKDGDTHVHVHAGEGNKSKYDDEAIGAHMDKNEKEHTEFRDAIAELQEKVNAMVPAKDTKIEDPNEKVGDDLAEEAPQGTADKARKALDSQYLEDSFKDTVALAEILAPGIRIPTFDKALSPSKSLDAICKLRRNALDLAYTSADTRGMIQEINGNKPLAMENMNCTAVRNLFRATAAMKRTLNNKQRANDVTRTAVENVIRTPADLNKAMAKAYANK